jgi:hypothetical protein
VALPRFIDLSQEALNASVLGVAGAVTSGAAINFGAFQANSANANVTRLNQANVCTSGTLNNLLTGTGGALLGTTVGGVAYSVGGTGVCNTAGAAASAVTCTITGLKGATSSTSNATVVCTG